MPNQVIASLPGKPRERYCSAVSTRTGQRCQKAPALGLTVCRFHQGKGVVKMVAQRNKQVNLELRAAKIALQKLNINAEEYELKDPRLVLLQTVTVAHTMMDAISEMVRALNEADIAQIGELPVPGMSGTAAGARAEAYMRLLGEWTDRAARAAKMALDAGVEERLVILAEKQGDMLVAAVRAAVTRVVLPAGLEGPLFQALAEELKLLTTPRLLNPPTPAEKAKAEREGLPVETAKLARSPSPLSPASEE